MNHLDEGTIHAWLDGALGAERAREVDAHVAGCAQCADAVAEARGLIAGASRILSALDDVPAGVTPHRATAPKRQWRAAPWVTGIAAVLVAAVVLQTGNEVSRSDQGSGLAARASADSVAGLIAVPSPMAATSSVAQPAEIASAPPRVEAPVIAASPRLGSAAGAGAAGAAGAAGVGEGALASLEAQRAQANRAALQRSEDAARERPSPPPAAVAADFQKAAVDEIVIADATMAAAQRLAGCYEVPAGDARQQLMPPREPVRRASDSRVAAPMAARAPAMERAAVASTMLLELNLTRRDSGFTVRAAGTDSAAGVWRVVGADSVEVRLASGDRLIAPRAVRRDCPRQ